LKGYYGLPKEKLYNVQLNEIKLDLNYQYNNLKTLYLKKPKGLFHPKKIRRFIKIINQFFLLQNKLILSNKLFELITNTQSHIPMAADIGHFNSIAKRFRIRTHSRGN
jgi:hypothetical protein